MPPIWCEPSATGPWCWTGAGCSGSNPPPRPSGCTARRSSTPAPRSLPVRPPSSPNASRWRHRRPRRPSRSRPSSSTTRGAACATTSFRATEAVEGAVFAIELHEASSGVLVYASDTGIMGKHFDALPGEGIADFFFEGMPLLGGTYTVTVGIRSRTGGTVYDWHDQAARFEVVNPTPVTGMVALALHAEVRGAVSG